MTKDDIINAGVEYTLAHNPVCLGGDAFADAMREFNRNRSFEAGAEWAAKVTEQEIIDRACTWIKTYANLYVPSWEDGITRMDECLSDFRKMMKENEN